MADYLAEMRVHNVNRPREGSRLMWHELRVGLAYSTSHRLDPDEYGAMVSHLDEQIYAHYGQNAATLNTP